MRHTNIRKRSDARYPIADTLWAIAGVILLLALGDVVIVLALALAAAALVTTWWIRHNFAYRARSSDVALASVSHLPAISCMSVHSSWHRHNAA